MNYFVKVFYCFIVLCWLWLQAFGLATFSVCLLVCASTVIVPFIYHKQGRQKVVDALDIIVGLTSLIYIIIYLQRA